MGPGALTVDLRGRAAVVSGGSSGIGRAIATRLAACGAQVVIGGRDAERCDRVVEELTAAGGSAVAVLGDIGDSATADRLVSTAVDRFGGLDIGVNAAGAIHRGDAVATTDDEWRHMMSTNVDGAFYLSRAAVPHLRRRGGGVIVNIGSTCGLVGAAGLAAYCAAKGAVTNLTRAMALDHAADDVRINAVCPGAVDTPMLAAGQDPGTDLADVHARNRIDIPQDRIPEPDEIAALVLFLCSDDARHITGANLSIDGGYTAR